MLKKILALSIFISAYLCHSQQPSLPFKIRQSIKDYVNKDLVICSFGASVTAQKDSIWDHFVHELNNRTGRQHTHVKMGYGGQHIHPTSVCRIDDIVAIKPDICILDWFDTQYVATNNITRLCLETLIRKLYEVDCHIIFYYHILNAGNGQVQINFIDYVDKIADEYNICSYYETEALLLQATSSIDDVLRDYVHTTPAGSIILGHLFCDYFSQIPISDENTIKNSPHKNYFYNVKKISITDTMIIGTFTVDQDGYYILDENSSLNINLKGYFLGFYMKIGPYSPIINLLKDDEKNYRYSLWDPWCHYERGSLNVSVAAKVLKKIKITMSADLPDYSKVRQPFDFSGIKKLLKIKEFFMC